MPHARIQLVLGDITTLDLDAIVNAANESLCGGGGVDGAIHEAAGPGLLQECRTIAPCPEGEARITGGHLLPAKHVIHTVGPVWNGGGYNEDEILQSCYSSSLHLAAEYHLRTIAFPCIATGVFLFPQALACKIAVAAVAEWLDTHELPHNVVFCCFEDEDFKLYQHRLGVIEDVS